MTEKVAVLVPAFALRKVEPNPCNKRLAREALRICESLVKDGYHPVPVVVPVPVADGSSCRGTGAWLQGSSGPSVLTHPSATLLVAEGFLLSRKRFIIRITTRYALAKAKRPSRSVIHRLRIPKLLETGRGTRANNSNQRFSNKLNENY